ncbi:MAG TPA: pyranose oxidase [Solirubrobacteraceae bacterium]|jgi:pyranose oxidase|nr:pyranose oxidase [Solirubrobacteraceae bacterium]
MNSSETIKVDAFIAGSGPIGATFARELVEAGRHVMVVDAGAKLSDLPGAHLKNSALYQRNIDLFASVIRGHLTTVSVPSNHTPVVTLDPAAFRVDFDTHEGFVHNNQNPEQSPSRNLDAAAVSYVVGGMATHWTCATPRHHPTIERCDLLSENEWEELYSESERRFGTTQTAFSHAIRHQLVLDILTEEFGELEAPYQAQALPLAVRRRTDNPRFVHWSGTDTVLGPLAHDDHDGRFDLRPEHICRRLALSVDGSHIEYAEVEDLTSSRMLRVEAEHFIVACNAINTPQLLWASGVRSEPLGRYLTEQPMAFCQIVLPEHRLGALESDDRFAEQLRRHRIENPSDPVPLPFGDPEPNCMIPVSEGRPWHCQIHRDAFNYGDLPPNIDGRLIVDLRWFGIVDPQPDNRVTFSERHLDIFGMPQATFEFELSGEDRERQHRMMKDMLRCAGSLGGFLPGSEPQFVPPGVPLHFAGTVRMGDDPATSVCDVDSKVWDVDNLYVGGNGLIPRGQATNPTLTSVAVAIKSARSILAPSAGRDRVGDGQSK